MPSCLLRAAFSPLPLPRRRNCSPRELSVDVSSLRARTVGSGPDCLYGCCHQPHAAVFLAKGLLCLVLNALNCLLGPRRYCSF